MAKPGLIAQTLRRAKHSALNSYRESVGLRPRIEVRSGKLPLVTLGSEIGRWTFADDPNLMDSTIVSCGAGEDISFDLLFARKYRAKVIVVDPTPRAIAHVNAVLDRLREAEAAGTLDTLELYGTRGFGGLGADQIELVPNALWKEACTLRFFPPKNPEHVSHSAVDFQNDYAMSGDYIEVEAMTYGQLVERFGISHLPLLKLDIEGAEIEVIESMRGSPVMPGQICLEYDEMMKPSRASASRVERAHAALLDYGYAAVHKDGFGGNFLYVRR